MKTHSSPVKSLSKYEIFVFGSNLQGFHGAGAAGFASFGVFGNNWRKFNYAQKPNGWKGLWNVKGKGEGLQQGTIGWSYALPTVIRPGTKRSRTKIQIMESIAKLYNVAERNRKWTFLVAQSNRRGLNGYEPEEMVFMFKVKPIPDNISFDAEFAQLFI